MMPASVTFMKLWIYFAWILWIAKRQSSVGWDKWSSENEVLSTTNQFQSSPKRHPDKLCLSSKLHSIKKLHKILNSIFLNFNSISFLFIHLKQFQHFVSFFFHFTIYYFNGWQSGWPFKVQIYGWIVTRSFWI